MFSAIHRKAARRAYLTLGFCAWGLSSLASAEPAPSAGIPSRPSFDFSIWETVHVQADGLEKSLYTYASETMRETVGDPNYGGRSPIENLFSLAFEPERWKDEKVVKITYPELREAMGGKKVKYVSPAELFGKFPELRPQAEKDKAMETDLMHAMSTADKLFIPAQGLKIVPAVDFRGEKTDWNSVEEVASRVKTKSDHETSLIAAWTGVIEAFVAGDAAKFNDASHRAVASLNAIETPTFKPAWKFSLDAWNSKWALFRKAAWIYFAAALVYLVSYLAGQKMFSWLAGGLLTTGAAVHVAALIIWGILADRTPVANLFEASAFIVGSMTVFSVVISAYYKTRVVGLAGASLGAFFMGIANNIPSHYGTKMLPLIDALQSYWLRIHVTSMLASYAFFALSFFTAAAWLVRRWMLMAGAGKLVAVGAGGGSGTINVDDEDSKEDATLKFLDGLTFRIITIGFPILTGGVILGAVWASEAWGRPWAFDPKETAAAITWMIYALYLHCRLFLGWRGAKGIWLSILGFAAVVFTYLGVSFFLPGLHSYVSEGVSFTDFLKNIIPGI